MESFLPIAMRCFYNIDLGQPVYNPSIDGPGCFCGVLQVVMVGEVARGHCHEPPKPPLSMVRFGGLACRNL